MLVSVVTTWFPTAVAPSSGGFVLRDCLAIRDAGAQVRVIHLVPPHQDDGVTHLVRDGLRVLRVPMRPADPLSVARAARRLPALLEGSDLVHSMAMSSLLPLFGLDLARGLSLPWVHTEHWSGLTNPGTLTPALRAGKVVVGAALGRPDVVTAVCEYLAQPIRHWRAEAPTVVVPCIVEPGPAPAPRRWERQAGQDAGQAGEDPCRTGQAGQETGRELALISVGGLVERKDPLMCVEVLAELVSRGCDATLTFVGDGPLRQAVLECAGELEVAGRVRLTGTLEHEAVRAELEEADLFLGPTRGDNFFVSAAEAIIAGRPVLVSDAGGQTEYVTDMNGTVLAAGSSAREWADAAEATLARLDGVSAAQVAATIGDRFSSASVGRGYLEVYRDLLG